MSIFFQTVSELYYFCEVRVRAKNPVRSCSSLQNSFANSHHKVILSSGGSRSFRGGWLREPDGSWGGLGLRKSFMHLWIRTWA